jgi:hypothetical protein
MQHVFNKDRLALFVHEPIASAHTGGQAKKESQTNAWLWQFRGQYTKLTLSGGNDRQCRWPGSRVLLFRMFRIM